MIAFCITLGGEAWELAKKEFAKFTNPKTIITIIKWQAEKTHPGYDGCRQAHLGILRYAKENFPNKPILIFEDDVFFESENPFSKIRDAVDSLPKQWDMLYLGATLNERPDFENTYLFKIKNAWTTHAILLNPTNGLFDFIIENNGGGGKIDVFYAKNIQHNFNCYISSFLIATQRNGYSNILNRDVDNRDVILESFKRYTQ